VLETLLKIDSNGRIRYNHLQLSVTYKAPVSLWTQRIQETQSENTDLENYTNRKAMYIPRNIAKEFIKEFHKNLTQGHNRATALVQRLEKEYIVYGVHALARQMTKECPDCQRNKFLKHKPYRELQPVKTLSRLWEVILWDFITKLPKSKDSVTEQEHNAVLVIIDKLTK